MKFRSISNWLGSLITVRLCLLGKDSEMGLCVCGVYQVREMTEGLAYKLMGLIVFMISDIMVLITQNSTQ